MHYLLKNNKAEAFTANQKKTSILGKANLYLGIILLS